MGDLPKKALLVGKHISVDEKDANGNSHTIPVDDRGQQVTSVDEQSAIVSANNAKTIRFKDPVDGRYKDGIFKPVGPKFSELNAKYSVATSIELRFYLGNKAAEERLVFDGNRIVGIVSIKEDFKTFATRSLLWGGFEPNSDKAPDTSQLAEANMMEQLIFAYIFRNADGHPDNMSLTFMFDFDWYWSDIVLCIKGDTIGFNHLTEWPVKDDVFANLPASAADFCPHHMTRSYPATGHPGKLPYNPEVFRNLAAFPNINGFDVQEQFYLAWLKFFTLYQPDVLKQEMYNNFGDIALDFCALPIDRQQRLKEKYPLLFNETSNAERFVDHKMKVFQDNYDRLSRKYLVEFLGVEKNNFQVRVPAFWEYISQHPSVHKKLIDELERLNQQTGIHHDIAAFERRYHQVFRDSFTTLVKNVLSNFSKLTSIIQEKYSLPDKKEGSTANTVQPVAADLTSAWAIINNQRFDNKTVNLDCHKNSIMTQAYDQLLKMKKDFFDLVTTYFQSYAAIEQVTVQALTSQANGDFVAKLTNLLIRNDKLSQDLMRATTQGRLFDDIKADIGKLINLMNLGVHLVNHDERYHSLPNLSMTTSVQLDLHDDSLVVENLIKTLFEKVKEWSSDEFEQVCNISFDIYNKTVKTCNRPEVVKLFLAKSKNQRSDWRLSYILLEASNKKGTLNQTLVTELIKKMINANNQFDVNFPAVRRALENGKFNTEKYTEKACEWANSSKEFVHEYTKEGRRQFFGDVFKWIGKLEKPFLDDMIQQAINLYLGKDKDGNSTSWFSGKMTFFGLRDTRESEVVAYQKDCDYADPLSKMAMVAKIFNPNAATSDLSKHLFDLILQNMPKSTNTSILAIQEALINSQADKVDKGVLRQSFLTDLHLLYSNFYSQPRTQKALDMCDV